MDSEEVPMRKVVAAEFVSLDGVVESPEKWHFPYFNDQMGEAIGAKLCRLSRRRELRHNGVL
jgi:hypothetical protein